MKNNIALIFDFDDTLATDTTSHFLAQQGVDVEKFWREEVDGLIANGWDPIPAYLYQMVQTSKSNPIFKNSLIQFSKQIELHKGVSRFFNLIQNETDFNVMFFVISSGIGDIIRNSQIAKHFTNIWCSEFSYDSEQKIEFPKRVISFTDKTRYIFSISKGFYTPEYDNLPFEVNKRVDDNDRVVPFQNMIYIGDGYTDVPCFSLIKKAGGIPIAVYDKSNKKHWERAWGFIEEGRVMNLLSADYTKGSDLYNNILMAINTISKKSK